LFDIVRDVGNIRRFAGVDQGKRDSRVLAPFAIETLEVIDTATWWKVEILLASQFNPFG